MQNNLKLSFSALLLLTLCAKIFAQDAHPDPNQNGPTPGVYSPTSVPPALQPRYPRYKVLPEDVLSISFPLSTELNFTATVQPDGYISIPNVGSVYVRGETVVEIVETLKTAYVKILHDPIIDVNLTNFQHSQFVVTGQVGRPGRYDLRSDTTVSEGIAIGGGLLGSAKSQVFLLHRVSPDWVEVKKLDVKKIMRGKNVNEDVHLESGDLIFVPDTFITKFRRYVPYTGPGLGTGLGFSGDALVDGKL